MLPLEIICMRPRLQDQGIVANPDVLAEEHIPADVPGRESQIEELRTCLLPASRGEKPLHVWMSGPPGAGKTLTSRFVIKRLRHESGATGLYLDCFRHNSFFAVLEELLSGLHVLCAQERSASYKLEQVQKHLGDRPLVIILDEIDQVPLRERNAILYHLSTLGRVGIVCIGTSRMPMMHLEPKVLSRLHPVTIGFQPYTVADITTILENRAQAALYPEGWNRRILERIAELSEGDARVAVQTLRSAANIAEGAYAKFIETPHIHRGFASTSDLKRQYILKTLTEHHRLLYQLVRESGPIASRDLRRLYLDGCRERNTDAVAPRTFTQHLGRLAELHLLKADRASFRGRMNRFRVVE